MVALLALGAGDWRPSEVSFIERELTQTVVRYGTLSVARSNVFSYKEQRKFVLPGLTAESQFGYFSRMAPNGEILAVTGTKGGVPTVVLIHPGRREVLTKAISSPIQMEWSPRSDRLAILAYDDRVRRAHVALFNVRSKKWSEIGIDSYRIAWRRDGTRLLAARRVRGLLTVPYRELSNRGSGMPEPAGERLVLTSVDPSSMAQKGVSIEQGTRWIVGDIKRKDVRTLATSVVWSPHRRRDLKLGQNGALVYDILPQRGSTGFDLLLNESPHVIRRLGIDGVTILDGNVLDLSTIGYAHRGPLFKGQLMPGIEGVRITRYDAIARRPKTWIIKNQRAVECMIHWRKG